MSFGNKWIKPHAENVGNKLLEGLKPQLPLKPRIEAQNRLHLQISKPDSISNKMQEKDQLIFKRIVHSVENHDSNYARVLSSKLSQVRKMNKMVISARLARTNSDKVKHYYRVRPCCCDSQSGNVLNKGYTRQTVFDDARGGPARVDFRSIG